MDVHVNRIPASGRVTRSPSSPAGFCRRIGTTPARANERSEIWIDHGGQTVVARQIVGMLARRVVCRVARGRRVRAGDRFGIMKFGSRMDVFLPHDSHDCSVDGRRHGPRRAKPSSRCYTEDGNWVVMVAEGLPESSTQFSMLCVPEDGRLRFLRRGAARPRSDSAAASTSCPSLFTMGNMFCGYACIVYAMRGEFETAAPFIGFAIVLDMLDGRIARLTGTASDFGVRVRFAGRRHLVRHRAGDSVVRVGTAAARPAGLGGRVSCS